MKLLPPQTVGVQPIYRLLDSHSSGEWGLSALRVSVHYTEGQQAIANAMTNASDPQHQTTLWWQGCQHTVQFRSAK